MRKSALAMLVIIIIIMMMISISGFFKSMVNLHTVFDLSNIQSVYILTSRVL